MTSKEELLPLWLKHKKAEDKAKAKRVEIEKELEAIYGSFDKSSKTFQEKDLGFKVNIKKNVAYNLDEDAYLSLRAKIPVHLRPEKVTFTVNVKAFKFLKESKKLDEREAYLMVSDCVEIKTNKTTVKVEKI